MGQFTTAWMLPMLTPAGTQIRARMGSSSYSLLPVADFECPWHRRDLAPDAPRRHFETTGERLVLPCETKGPWRGSLREEALDGLDTYQLPDLRNVVPIPRVANFGTALKGEWERIKDAAREARGPVMAHAYDVSREILQRWKEVGSSTLQVVHDGNRRIRSGESILHPSLSLPRGDIGLMDWISAYAPELHYRDVSDPYYVGDRSDNGQRKFEERMRTLVPFQEAYAVLAASTGYSPSTVKKIIERSRSARPASKEAKPTLGV